MLNKVLGISDHMSYGHHASTVGNNFKTIKYCKILACPPHLPTFLLGATVGIFSAQNKNGFEDMNEVSSSMGTFLQAWGYTPSINFQRMLLSMEIWSEFQDLA